MKNSLFKSAVVALVFLLAGFNSVAAGASVSDETAAAEEKTASQILDEFSGYFDYLYGRTYDGYLWDYADENKEAENHFDGYDRTDIPTISMGSYVYDFDQDGQEELLIVHISSDYNLQFSMYEITDEKKVYAADTYTLLNITGEHANEQYAIEQGSGSTDIFLYEYDGPRLLALCTGTGMTATGHPSHCISVKYDGHKFVQDIEPLGFNKFAGFHEESLESCRASFQSFGTKDLSDEACEEIFNNIFSITKYLEKPREIARASTESVDDYYKKYEEWRQGSKDERFKATTIYFYSKEELKDSAD